MQLQIASGRNKHIWIIKTFERNIVMKIIIFLTALATIGFTIAARIFYEGDGKRTKTSNILISTAFSLYVAHVVLKVTMSYGVFTVPWLLLLMAAVLFIIFIEELDFLNAWPSYIVLIISIVGYAIAGNVYLEKVVKANEVSQDITTTKIVCKSNTEADPGSMKVYYITSDIYTDEYKFYCETENGGIKLETISADNAEIQYVDSVEEARFEEIAKTTYYLDNNKNPAKKCLENTTHTYIIYAPEELIVTIYGDEQEK